MSFLEICGGVFLILVALIGLLTFLAIQALPKRLPTRLQGVHVLITGGSKGIGKALAAEFLRRGAQVVTIAARNLADLEVAKKSLEATCKPDQRVHTLVLDITSDYNNITKSVEQLQADVGAVNILVNNAGFVVQGAFHEIPVDSFASQMNINYVGAAQLTRALLPSMKAQGCGHVCFVSSAAGQCPIWGYSSYSPSKSAVKSLADVLFIELLPFKIGVSVLYPPNTETEGFEVEKKEMPEQIRQISGSAGLFSAEHVAKDCVNTIQNGDFSSSVGFEGWMLSVLTAGGSPEASPLQVVAQTLLSGPFRAIMLIYHGSFHTIVKTLHKF